MPDKKETDNWKTYKRLLGYAMRYKKRLFIGVFFGLVTGSTVIGILLQADTFLQKLAGGPLPLETQIVVQNGDEVKKLKVTGISLDEGKEKSTPAKLVEGDVVSKVTEVVEEEKAPLPGWAMNFITETLGINIVDGDGKTTGIFVILAAIGLALVFFVRAVSSYVNRFFMRWVGVRVVTDMRKELFQKLLKQSMEFHGRESIGAMMSRCSNDINDVQSAVSNNISSLIRAPMEILAVIIFIIMSAFKYDSMGSFMLIMFIAMPLSILPVVVLGKKLKKYAGRTLNKISLVMDRMQETFSCIRVVKAFNMESYEVKEFENTNERHFKMVMKAHKYELLITPLMEFVAVTAVCVLMIYSFTQGIAFNKILILVAAANFAYGPLKELAKLNAKIQRSLAAADRIFDYMDMTYEIPQKDSATIKNSFDKQIVFKDVDFFHGDKQILNKINLQINKGQFVAFVGEAGCGKSSLVNLVARFYDAKAGSISIDGTDVKDFANESLHKLIGYVDQRTILFNESVKYNVAYGVENATEEQVKQAVERADVAGFIGEKEEGLDFNVGAKGIKLSGGQCQRVAIARAMLKNPPIMILDEATSALDNVTEQIVQKAINELMGDRTVLAIAHRLSTVKDADCIYVLDKGNIVEQGTHEKLLKNQGQYAKMWNAQFRD